MKTIDIAIAIGAKLDDLRQEIMVTKRGEGISANTVHTKLNKLSRERRTLELIHLMVNAIAVEDLPLNKEQAEFFQTLTRLSEDKAAYVARGVVEVNEGDTVMGLLAKYQDVKDIYNKIMKEVAKKGLTLQADGSITRA